MDDINPMIPIMKINEDLNQVIQFLLILEHSMPTTESKMIPYRTIRPNYWIISTQPHLYNITQHYPIHPIIPYIQTLPNLEENPILLILPINPIFTIFTNNPNITKLTQTVQIVRITTNVKCWP
jgi:hypothetical protein